MTSSRRASPGERRGRRAEARAHGGGLPRQLVRSFLQRCVVDSDVDLPCVITRVRGVHSSLWARASRPLAALRDGAGVFVPAAASSLLLAGVAATDVYFASADPGGAAALSFAFLLAMAPIGVASTSLVVRLIKTRSHARQRVNVSPLFLMAPRRSTE